ncbi:MAG: hypothetical protein Fues2KO_32170 [Fuerstiella sp.]
MADAHHECLELASEWQESLGACFTANHEISRRLDQLVHRIYSAFNDANRAAIEGYLASIGIEEPTSWMTEHSDMSPADAALIQEKLKAAGSKLLVRRFIELPLKVKTLGQAMFLERASIREGVYCVRWCAESAEIMGWQNTDRHIYTPFTADLLELAFDIEIAGDALDILNAESRFPFDRRVSLVMAGELVELTHPDTGWRLGIGPVLRAYLDWKNEWNRLVNWMMFKDKRIKRDFDPVETKLLSKPRLLARYRLLKQRKHPVMFSSVVDEDELWQADVENRTNGYMQRGFKELQKFLTDHEFDHLELSVTKDSAALRTI